MPNIWASKSLVSTYPLFYSNLLYLDQVHLKEEHNVEPLLYKANNMYGDYVCQVSDVTSELCYCPSQYSYQRFQTENFFPPIHHNLRSKRCNYGTVPRSYLSASNSWGSSIVFL
jgi:hypothetical protein